MLISTPIEQPRKFAASNILMPPNGKVIYVNEQVEYYPLDAYTVQGGVRSKKNPWLNPYRYKLVGTNALGLTMELNSGKIVGQVLPIATKSKSVILKVAVFDSINRKGNFLDPNDMFTRVKLYSVLLEVRWPSIIVDIPTQKLSIIKNINDMVDINPFDDNGKTAVSGGSMRNLQFEFDTDYMKLVYANTSFFSSIEKMVFGDLLIDNNTGQITGKITTKFLEFFNGQIGTKIIPLYFVVRDRFNNISGVNDDGIITNRIKIDLVLNIPKLYIIEPNNPINISLNKTVDNTNLNLSVISKIVGGLKPYTVFFESDLFGNNFQLISQLDDSVKLSPITPNLPIISRKNNQSSAIVKVIDSSGQTTNTTAFIEVY